MTPPPSEARFSPRIASISDENFVDECIERVSRCEILPENTMKQICDKVKEILVNESNVLQVSSPVTVVGDVHGQFFDVMEMFRIAGMCPNINFLFLGDFVDRGYFSLETVTLLICLKLRWPNRVQLLRGNHESRQTTQVYGFYSECIRKYGNADVWKALTDLFDYLTIAAVIDNVFFCVHGGLSPSIHVLDQLRVLDRFKEVPHEGCISDLLWSDPEPEKPGFHASQRGAGYMFGHDICEKFVHINNIQLILRAHQLCMEGYQVLFDDKLCTVWSAPNYCYRCGNFASVLEIDEGKNRYFNLFGAAPDTERVVPSADSLKEVPEYWL